MAKQAAPGASNSRMERRKAGGPPLAERMLAKTVRQVRGKACYARNGPLRSGTEGAMRLQGALDASKKLEMPQQEAAQLVDALAACAATQRQPM